MRLFGSIEKRHGVEEPDYRPPDADQPLGRYERIIGALVTPLSLVLRQLTRDDGKVGAVEIVGSLFIPVAGIVFAIMRFTDDEVGAGLACLLTGIVGAFCWTLALGLA